MRLLLVFAVLAADRAPRCRIKQGPCVAKEPLQCAAMRSKVESLCVERHGSATAIVVGRALALIEQRTAPRNGICSGRNGPR